MRFDLGDVLTITTGRSLFFSRKGVFALASFLINAPVEADETKRARPALRETLIAAHPQLPNASDYLDLPNEIAASGAFSHWLERLGPSFEVSDLLLGSVVFFAAEGAYRPKWLNPISIQPVEVGRARAVEVDQRLTFASMTKGGSPTPKTVLMGKRSLRPAPVSLSGGHEKMTSIVVAAGNIEFQQAGGRAGRMSGPESDRETCDA